MTGDFKWKVRISKRAQKRAGKMPKQEQSRLEALAKDLVVHGPVLPHWPSYSKLGDNRYHCHLSYKWVACWMVEDNVLKLIEVYYAGSREDAPY